MNLFSISKLSLLVLSFFPLVGCDSDTPLLPGGTRLSDITGSDETVVAGELFTLEATFSVTPQQNTNNFRVIADNEAIQGVGSNATAGDTRYTYEQTGEFTATLSAVQDIDNTVPAAVNQTFSSSNPANGEIRNLLLVRDTSLDAPDLTSDELDRLIELFNVSGAQFFRESDTSNTILVSEFEVWNFTSTSTQEERVTGLIGGTYSFESSTTVISFERTFLSDNEGNTIEFYIPILSGVDQPLTLMEQGTYTLQLVNEVGL